jgi:hypothetical protein
MRCLQIAAVAMFATLSACSGTGSSSQNSAATAQPTALPVSPPTPNWSGPANLVDVRRNLGKRAPPILSNVPRLGPRLTPTNPGFGQTTMRIRGKVLPSVATPSRGMIVPPGMLPSARIGPLRGLPTMPARTTPRP